MADEALERETHARCEAWIRARVTRPAEGIFGARSVAWTLVREPAYLFGGAAAVLLQMAHPAVVAGVSAHSSFERDLFGRIRRTSQALYSLVFGDLDDGLRTSRRMHAIHTRVHGVVNEPGSPWEGRAYRANEQPLLRWVSMTASVMGRRAFESFVRPLSAEERAGDWEDIRRGAVASGVDPDGLATSREDFHAQFEETCATSADLWVGPRARSVARVLFSAPLGVFDPVVTAALLPPRVRAMYELPWGAAEERRFALRRKAFGRIRGAAPEALRYVPAWHQARRRVAEHAGGRGALWGRVLDAASARFDVPAGLRAR